jgi:hypothetical protein
MRNNSRNVKTCVPVAGIGLAVFLAPLAAAERTIISVNGTWQIEESLSPDAMPAKYSHSAEVPGLVNTAEPVFPGVDEFDSAEQMRNKIRERLAPASAMPKSVGVRRQQRTHFWYRRTVQLPAAREVALLRIHKAQFGTAAWVNGKPVGEHAGCFTAGTFNITAAVRWSAANEIVVRVGADPLSIPSSVPAGTDFEKLKWTPGIYDDAELILADNPVIDWVQVAPDLSKSRVTVQTQLRNYGSSSRTVQVRHAIGSAAGTAEAQVPANATASATAAIDLPGAHLWTPEDPHLYTLISETSGDRLSTRFGMRELRFDTATKRAYLNGKIYFLRGSNITLHRFFEDPDCKRLPWDEKWVRKLLVDVPKQMHWNSFRLCIGPVPRKWLDIADEAGLLLQYEYPIWTSRDPELWHNDWTRDALITEYSEFMRDNWNHPSVALWDAGNETDSPLIRDEVLPRVRKLDLSGRQWENGYTLPSGPDDPVEDHPYLFSAWHGGGKFHMTTLEKSTGAKSTNSPHPTGHTAFINEYGWTWLNRDGSPTKLTQAVYDGLIGKDATPDQRFAWNAYWVAGLTEYWRAHRNFAGVLHFVYLTASFPGAYTSDHWQDVKELRLEPRFADWVGQSFQPLGVYINFWQPEVKAGRQRFAVMMVNDYGSAAEGKLRLTLETKSGDAVASAETAFAVPSAGQQSYELEIAVPDKPGDYVLRALAESPAAGSNGPTISRRWVQVKAPTR